MCQIVSVSNGLTLVLVVTSVYTGISTVALIQQSVLFETKENTTPSHCVPADFWLSQRSIVLLLPNSLKGFCFHKIVPTLGPRSFLTVLV